MMEPSRLEVPERCDCTWEVEVGVKCRSKWYNRRGEEWYSRRKGVESGFWCSDVPGLASICDGSVEICLAGWLEAAHVS
jgi:hypothetical protein